MTKETALGHKNANWSQKKRSCALPYIPIILITLIGAALRLYNLGEASLWYDEAGSLYLANQHADFTLASLAPDKNTEPPLFLYIARGWSALAGLFDLGLTSQASDFLIRLLPCLAGIACIPLLYAVTLVITTDKRVALLAALLYSVSPFQVYYAHEFRAHTLYTAMCLATAYCAVNALRNNTLRHWSAMTILMAAMMYLHYSALWFIAALNAYGLLTFKTHRPRLRPWIFSQSTVLILIVPAILTASRISTYFENIKYNWFPAPTPKTALITFKTFFAGYSQNVMAYWTLFIVAAALTIVGCYTYRRRWSTLALLLSLIIVPIIASLIIWNIRFPMYEHRLFVAYGAIACILVAAGLSALAKPLRIATVGIFVAATAPCLADAYAHRLHPVEAHRIGVWDKVQLREAAAFITDNHQDGDHIGHPSHFTWYSLRYYCPIPQSILAYTDADLTSVIDNFGCESVIRENQMMPEKIELMAEKAKRIWLPDATGIVFQSREKVQQYRAWLEAHAVLEQSGTFQGLTVSCYRIVHQALPQSPISPPGIP